MKLNGKHIVVGITGGIAAYKTIELIRLLRKAEAEVRVVLTPAAAEFQEILSHNLYLIHKLSWQWGILSLPNGPMPLLLRQLVQTLLPVLL